MSNKLPTTSLGRLVRKLKKTPMTHRQITTFLLKEAGQEYAYGRNHDYYNSSLYGTSARTGLLEKYGVKVGPADQWRVVPTTPENGPFTTIR